MKRIVLFLSLLVALPSCSFNLKTFLQRKKPGTIVLLNGTSSAGKTSIVRELQEIYGNSYEALVGDKFLETYEIEHPMPESMSNDDYQFQILSALFLHAKQLSNDGKNVLVDVVDFDNRYQDYCAILDCDSTVKILVYCPLDVIVDRVQARNKSGQAKEERPLNLSFGQFTGIYKLQESPDEMIVDRIATSRMLQALQTAKEEVRVLMQQAGVKPEDFETNIMLFAQPLIDQFKLNERKEIALVPKHKWDLVVNTGIHSPAEVAQEIVQYLKSKD